MLEIEDSDSSGSRNIFKNQVLFTLLDKGTAIGVPTVVDSIFKDRTAVSADIHEKPDTI